MTYSAKLRLKQYDAESRLRRADRREIQIRSIVQQLARGAHVVLACMSEVEAKIYMDEIRQRLGVTALKNVSART